MKEKLTLNRIILFCYQIDKLKSFYTDNFNFLVAEDIPGQWVVLKTGQIEIALHKVGQEYEPKDGKPFRVKSNTKLVFHISDNLEGFRKLLLDKGVLIDEIKSFKGINSLFCDGEDPEGNMFQIEQRL